ITTNSAEAQRWFDQGLRLVYAFNHLEAQRAFREAARLDPACAMCYWGIAITEGSNYNDPTNADREKKAATAAQEALSLSAGARPPERAMIQALAKRHSTDPAAKRESLDRTYAEAMREVARQFPDDLEAGTFFADSMMNLRPWNLWTADGAPQPGTEELVATLERVIAKNPNHPGALHLYIHAVEASREPGRAEAAADRLRPLMPGAGHLVHMPSHIYWRIGRYAAAVTVNTVAAVAPVVALARFGRWDEVLAYPAPPREWPYTSGVWHYARGVTFNAKGQAADAKRELSALEGILQSVSPDRTLAFFFRSKNMLQ